MKIVSVQAKNFRSYPELSWALPESGLFLIDGRNLDTGRSNMVGKTTLIDSIIYAIYGYLPKWGGPKGGPVDAVIRRGQVSCRVEVILQHAGKEIRIIRERPAKLVVFVNQERLDGKISDLDSRIPELVGMTAGQVIHLSLQTTHLPLYLLLLLQRSLNRLLLHLFLLLGYAADVMSLHLSIVPCNIDLRL